jgi:hypothetical protein
VKLDSFEQLYSSKTDDELLALASHSLTLEGFSVAFSASTSSDGHSSTRPLFFRFVSFDVWRCLGDRQNQRLTGSAAGAADIACSPARSIDLHAGGSSSGDHCGRDRGLQLLTAGSQSGNVRTVDDHDRRRNKLTAVHNQQKALLYLRERNRARGNGCNDRRWPRTSAQGIDRVAALEHKQGEQCHAERCQESADSVHSRMVHPPVDRNREEDA